MKLKVSLQTQKKKNNKNIAITHGIVSANFDAAVDYLLSYFGQYEDIKIKVSTQGNKKYIELNLVEKES